MILEFIIIAGFAALLTALIIMVHVSLANSDAPKHVITQNMFMWAIISSAYAAFSLAVLTNILFN